MTRNLFLLGRYVLHKLLYLPITTTDCACADLGRLMYCGFKGLCGAFTSQHDQHYVVPVRINGSAIESLFSRFKYDAGGNLSATNYESAISRLLTANAVSEGKKEESTYRKDKLSVSCGLKRKSK